MVMILNLVNVLGLMLLIYGAKYSKTDDEDSVDDLARPTMIARGNSEKESEASGKGSKKTPENPEGCTTTKTRRISMPCDVGGGITKTVISVTTETRFKTVTVQVPLECPSLPCRDTCASQPSRGSKRTTSTEASTGDTDDVTASQKIIPSPTRFVSNSGQRCSRDIQTIRNSQVMTSITLFGTFASQFKTEFKFWQKRYGTPDPSEPTVDPFPSKDYPEFMGPATYSRTRQLNPETVVITTEYRTQTLSGTTYLALRKEETRIHLC